jgi:Flp pilus assembly protein TadG
MTRDPRHDEGLALVEFALLLPIIVILLVGVFDVAFAVWRSNTLTSAVREGTRYAIVNGATSTTPLGPGNDSTVGDVVRRGAIGLSNVVVTVSWPDSPTTTIVATANAGQAIVVVASTSGFKVGDVVHVYSGATLERHTISSILAGPASLQMVSNLTNTFLSGTVAAAGARGDRVNVLATAEHTPVLSQAFIGGALRVTLRAASELVVHR